MRTLLSVASLLLLALLSHTGAAASQQEGHVAVPSEKWSGYGAKIRDTLADHGFKVGKNLIVDVRHAHGDMIVCMAGNGSLTTEGVER
jgi:hypothetical protein